MLTFPLQLGDPVEHRGVVLAPVFPRRTPVARYVTLDDALAGGLRVTEVDAAGAVPELAVANPLDAHVLLHDGEELVGAKQNRILNVTVLVGARSKLRIPVSCVEQGRWASRSAKFSAARHLADPELRRRKNERIAEAPLARGEAQHEVWNAVREKALRLGAVSPTAAHADTFALGTESVCLDYVSRPDAFARLYPKLLAGYALDAAGAAPREPVGAERLEAFVASVARSRPRRQPSEGLGEDVRLEADGVLASGLALEGELLQLSAFSRPGGRATTIASPSRRR